MIGILVVIDSLRRFESDIELRRLVDAPFDQKRHPLP
jgi:hypothetical protein